MSNTKNKTILIVGLALGLVAVVGVASATAMIFSVDDPTEWETETGSFDSVDFAEPGIIISVDGEWESRSFNAENADELEVEVEVGSLAEGESATIELHDESYGMPHMQESVSEEGTTTFTYDEAHEDGSTDYTVWLFKNSGEEAVEIDSLSVESYEYPEIVTGQDDISDAEEGSEYTQEIHVEDGEAPYEWLIADGELPDGVSMDDDSMDTDTLLLEGTPTETGEFTFTVEVSDYQFNSDSQEYTLTVAEETEDEEESTIDVEEDEETEHTVTVEVVDSNDEIIENADVEFLQENADGDMEVAYSGETDSDGYAYVDVHEAVYTLSVDADGYKPAEAEIAVENDVNVYATLVDDEAEDDSSMEDREVYSVDLPDEYEEIRLHYEDDQVIQLVDDDEVEVEDDIEYTVEVLDEDNETLAEDTLTFSEDGELSFDSEDDSVTFTEESEETGGGGTGDPSDGVLGIVIVLGALAGIITLFLAIRD